ncbi:hypothetical protein Tco_1208109 [Tanacetum coccineum]
MLTMNGCLDYNKEELVSRDSFTDYSWERVFSIRENVYKEWCLEFFSTMYFERKVDWSKIMEEKCVWFRLCGREHAYTFLEFAVILGLYTQSDIKHRLFRIRFSRLARNGKTFEHIEYWNRIGDPNDGRKKLSQFYDPFMQVLHKLIIGAFVHRAEKKLSPPKPLVPLNQGENVHGEEPSGLEGS